MIRDHWRLIVLVILLAGSLAAIFVPGASLAGEPVGATGAEATNIRFGLDLAGGTTIRAPLEGVTATETGVSPDNRTAVERRIAEELEGVSTSEVQARPSEGTIEILADVDPEEARPALDSAGVTYETVRMGVTEPTRKTAINVLQSKIDEAGFAGARVYQAETPEGKHFIVIAVPQHDRDEVRSLVEQRGTVELVASYPVEENGTTVQRRTTVIKQSDIQRVGRARQGDARTGPYVPIALTQDGAERYAAAMNAYGFTSARGTGDCPRTGANTTDSHCLLTVLNGEVVYSASMSRGLAGEIRSGEFNTSREFIITAGNYSEARQLQVNLRAGSLPSNLDFDRGTVQFVSPTLAENFKLYSLLTGILAVVAVVVAVSIRYRDPKIAIPMLFTALSEVVILLGFISFSGMPLSLAHIAGLIAAIGTGVDDLIIIADEVLTERVTSKRVFHNRFRKAFWVILAAAATTLIAMAPLAALSLGDLRGFAIITILGVVIGVSITRPAYGDILQSIVTDR